MHVRLGFLGLASLGVFASTVWAVDPETLTPRPLTSQSYFSVLTSAAQRNSPATVLQPGVDFVENFEAQTGQELVTLPMRIVVRRPLSQAAANTVVLPLDGYDLSNAGPMFREAIRRLGTGGRLLIGPGTYVFRPQLNAEGEQNGAPAIALYNLQDTVLGASDPINPPRLVFTNPEAPGIEVMGGRRVEVRDLVLSHLYADSAAAASGEASLARPGIVSRASCVTSPGLGSRDLASIGVVFSHDGSERWFADGASYHVTFEANATRPLANPLVRSTTNPDEVCSSRLNVFSVGSSVMLLRSRKGFGVTVTAVDSEDVSIRGLRLVRYPQMGITVRRSRGVWIQSNRITAAQNENPQVSGRADGIHLSNNLGDIVVQDNVVADQGDDGLNIWGMNFDITRIVPRDGSVQISGNRNTVVRPGDAIAITRPDLVPVYLTRVVRVAGSTVFLDWGTACDEACRRTILATDTTSRRIGIGFNLEFSSSRYVVRRNVFRNSGARGALVQSPNGVVTGNSFVDLAASAILAIADNKLHTSGPNPSNLVISDNFIRNVSYKNDRLEPARNAAIAISTPVTTSSEAVIGGILITRNRIVSSANGSINVNRAFRVEVSDNRLPGGAGAVPQVMNSSQVLVTGN